MVEQLGKLKQEGWAIVVWTVRRTDNAVRAHLEKYGVPFDYINKHPWQPQGSSHKIYADVYLDDKALRFDGNTESLAERVKAHAEPWWSTEKQASAPSFLLDDTDAAEQRLRLTSLVVSK